MNRLTLATGAILLASCSALEPTVRLEIEHTSHITQHFAAADNDLNCGYNAVMVDLHWQYERLHLDVADGLNVSPQDAQFRQAYGALAGPRETFQATASFDVWRPK